MLRQDRSADYALLPRSTESRRLDATDRSYRRYEKRRRLWGLCSPRLVSAIPFLADCGAVKNARRAFYRRSTRDGPSHAFPDAELVQ